MKSTNQQLLTGRDFRVLEFLWKWKVCTTAALSLKFFNGSAIVAYNRLRTLKKAGFIRGLSLSLQEKKYVWTLNQKGFVQLSEHLPALQQVGFASEALEHDFLSTSLQLGEWLVELPSGVEMVSEQELRRNFPSHLPNWVPDLDGRRPDGLWYLPYKERKVVMALEVEISFKDLRDYGPISYFYRDNDKISRVIWLVRKQAHIDALLKRFEEATPERYKRHTFILLDDFLSLGWGATLRGGFEEGKSLRYLLHVGQLPEGEEALKAKDKFYVSSLLDTRICPFKSTKCGKITAPVISNGVSFGTLSKPFANEERNF